MLTAAEVDKVRNLIFQMRRSLGKWYVSARKRKLIYSIPCRVRTLLRVPGSLVY